MKPTVVTIVLLCVSLSLTARGQEAVMEEVRVEASFSSGLELPLNRQVEILAERLRQRTETERAFSLQTSNQNAITTLLGLTRAIPIPLGASENRVDTFLLQNYIRADLNPPKGSPLFH
jgi:hypothetical protein